MNRFEVKKIRKSLRLTQAKLAEKMGVTLQTVQHWEAGRRSMSKTAEKLLLVFSRETEDQ